MELNILNEIDYPKSEIEKWIKTTYKNYFLRQKEEINKDKLLHLIDFLNSNYAPKELQGKSFGSIMKSLKNWENMIIQANSDEIVEEKVFENGDFYIVKLCSKNALIQEGTLMNHCIGRSSTYLDGLKDGSSLNYSVRTLNSERLATFEIKHFNSLKQIKGKENQKVEEENVLQIICCFLNNTLDLKQSLNSDVDKIFLVDNYFFTSNSLKKNIHNINHIKKLEINKQLGNILIPNQVNIDVANIYSEAFVEFEEVFNCDELKIFSIESIKKIPKKFYCKKNITIRNHDSRHKPLIKDVSIVSPEITLYKSVCLELKEGSYKKIHMLGESKLILDGFYYISKLSFDENGDLEIRNKTSLIVDSLRLTKNVSNYKELINKIEFDSLTLDGVVISTLNKEVKSLYLRGESEISVLNQKSINSISVFDSKTNMEKVSEIKAYCNIFRSSSILNDNLIIGGDLVINCSKIKLPKKLEVFGDFKIDYCEIEEWPEEMIVHGCFDYTGDNRPPSLNKYKLHSKKVFVAKEGLIEFDE